MFKILISRFVFIRAHRLHRGLPLMPVTCLQVASIRAVLRLCAPAVSNPDFWRSVTMLVVETWWGEGTCRHQRKLLVPLPLSLSVKDTLFYSNPRNTHTHVCARARASTERFLSIPACVRHFSGAVSDMKLRHNVEGASVTSRNLRKKWGRASFTDI